MISTADIGIAVALASATSETPSTPPEESLPRHGIHYYQMHHNHHAHHQAQQQQQQQQSQGHAHTHSHHHLHHHAHLQHLLQQFGDNHHNSSPYGGHNSRPGSATTPTTVIDDPSGPNADTCSSVSSTTLFGARICNRNCRCTNRLLTGIVITILPIAITSTLLFVFMMQKTNLHQYAIYSFVIFCVAFVFPFALFFFTVILNKIYKFYKRGIRTPNDADDMPDGMDGSCEDPFQESHHSQQSTNQNHAHNSIDHHNHVHLYHDLNNINANSNLVYYQPYYFTTMNYHSSDIPQLGVSDNNTSNSNSNNNNNRDAQYCSNSNVHYQTHHQHSQQLQQHHHQQQRNQHSQQADQGTNNQQIDNYLSAEHIHHSYDENQSRNSSAQESIQNSASSQSFEDSPPCYEMALLCPSVNSDDQKATALIETNSAVRNGEGLNSAQSYSPAKELLIKVETIDFKVEIGNDSGLQHSTPSTSRNPSQEEEVDSQRPEQEEDDKCSTN